MLCGLSKRVPFVCSTGFSRKFSETIPPKAGTTNIRRENLQPLRDS